MGWYCKSDIQYVSEKMTIFALWFFYSCENILTRYLICFLYVVIHSLYLFKLGLAPQIQDLYGKVDFTGKFKTKSLHLFSSVFP